MAKKHKKGLGIAAFFPSSAHQIQTANYRSAESERLPDCQTTARMVADRRFPTGEIPSKTIIETAAFIQTMVDFFDFLFGAQFPLLDPLRRLRMLAYQRHTQMRQVSDSAYVNWPAKGGNHILNAIHEATIELFNQQIPMTAQKTGIFCQVPTFLGFVMHFSYGAIPDNDLLPQLLRPASSMTPSAPPPTPQPPATEARPSKRPGSPNTNHNKRSKPTPAKCTRPNDMIVELKKCWEKSVLAPLDKKLNMNVLRDLHPTKPFDNQALAQQLGLPTTTCLRCVLFGYCRDTSACNSTHHPTTIPAGFMHNEFQKMCTTYLQGQ